MILDHLYLSILIFVLALAASAVVLTSEMRLWRKIVITILLCTGGMITYRGFNKFYGYPTMLQQSFKRVTVLGHLVDKKNKRIYLWLKHGKDDPRSYTIPFSHKMAKFLASKRKQHRGKPYDMKLDIKTDQTNPFGNTVDVVEPGEFMVFPPKEDQDDY